MKRLKKKKKKPTQPIIKKKYLFLSLLIDDCILMYLETIILCIYNFLILYGYLFRVLYSCIVLLFFVTHRLWWSLFCPLIRPICVVTDYWILNFMLVHGLPKKKKKSWVRPWFKSKIKQVRASIPSTSNDFHLLVMLYLILNDLSE